MLTTLFTQQLPKRQALLAVFISSTIWGLLWIPLRWLDNLGYQDLWSTFAFMCIPIVPLLIFAWPRMQKDRKHLPVYLLAGGLIGAGFGLYCTGLLIGSVTKTTLLFYLTPVWGSVLGMMFLGEKASISRWFANIMGLSGCVLILGINTGNIMLQGADALGFLAGFAWAFGGVLVRRFPDADFVVLTFWQYVLGSALTLVAIMMIGTPPPSVAQTIDGLTIAILTAFIFLPTMMLIFRISQYVSPGLVALLMMSEVVFAVFSAMLLLDETLTYLQWTGAACILSTGVFVAISSEARD
ncbi:MAG: DMT family transporter [Candidatus Puniceispirillales bacterium]